MRQAAVTRFKLEDLPPKMREQAKAALEHCGKPLEPLVAGAELRAQAELIATQEAVWFSQSRANKYKAMRVEADGIKFASRKEYRRYLELRLMEKAEEISGLRVHVAFALFDTGDNCRGELIGRYTSDFVYKQAGRLVVEDVKTSATARLRDWVRTKKLMRVCHGIEVTEIFRVP
jgi:hypothetical protein